MRALLVIALGLLAWPPLAQAHEAKHAQHEERLPTIGGAPDFTLTSQDGAPVTLAELRGKVVAVTFIYTSCPDICPMLTDKMARVQDELGPDFGSKIDFLSITTDPERDTPAVLKEYAEALDADLAGWSFLTGKPAAVLDVAHRYGVAVAGGGRPGRPHAADDADRPAGRHARAVSRLPVRRGGVPPRPPEPRERALMRLRNLAVELVSRVPARVQIKLLVAFLAMVALLILLGAVGLRVLSGMNERNEELIELQRKIAAYRQVQHDTTRQLYGVASALLSQDERALDSRCASSASSATTSTGCSTWRRTRWICWRACGRTTTASSRSSPGRWSAPAPGTSPRRGRCS